MSEPLVDLVVEAPDWIAALPDLGPAADLAATAALQGAGLDPPRYTLCVLACDDARIARLNADFRGREAPTNVLSWPAFELAPQAPGAPPGQPPAPSLGAPVHLGDVAVALQTARAEAESRGVSLKSHAIHLILHGCLHLLGYDHQTEEDAARMEGLETRLLCGLGIEDPHTIMEEDAGPAAS